MDTQLSQNEIDRLFRKFGEGAEPAAAPLKAAVPYDFRRPDRIPKEQLRSIHLMHDFLARNLASSLGAYLRAYVTVSLVSVEQLSFGEFLQYLPTPTCISSIGMRPMDGNSVLELNPSLVFPILDLLLGGDGKAVFEEFREITEIERTIIEGVVRIVLNDLHEAWAPVANIQFKIDATETQPQLMQILSPNEAIVAIGFEITMGEARGMMNFGVPSILIKMMGQRFEQQWSARRREAARSDEGKMRTLLRSAPVVLDARLRVGGLRVDKLLDLAVGDVISLETPVGRPADVQDNGPVKAQGEIVTTGTRRAVIIAPPQSDQRGEKI